MLIPYYSPNNPDYKLGIAPTSKNHIQQYNPSEGKKWISNLDLKESIRIPKEDPIPKGWLIGRIINFDRFFEKYNNAMNKADKFHFIDFTKDLSNKIVPRILKNKSKKTSFQSPQLPKKVLMNFYTNVPLS